MTSCRPTGRGNKPWSPGSAPSWPALPANSNLARKSGNDTRLKGTTGCT